MGVTTCVGVSTTVRGGVEYNYRMILVSDAVAEVDQAKHEAEPEVDVRGQHLFGSFLREIGQYTASCLGGIRIRWQP
jgi:nicotinamidase-related amidase